MKFPRWRTRAAAVPELAAHPGSPVTFLGHTMYVAQWSQRFGQGASVDLIDQAEYERLYRPRAEDVAAEFYAAELEWTRQNERQRTQITDLQAQVASLREREAKLDALEAGGVDNWGGYESALEEAGVAPWQDNDENGSTES